MSTPVREVETLASQEYKFGFVTDIEQETVPPGLNEDTIRLISAKKREPEWLLEWRLKAYRHWLTAKEPDWANVNFHPIDYQAIIYYAAPKKAGLGAYSLDEVDPKLLETYAKLGIPLREQEWLAGVAVDAVFDSVSVATTFKAKLAELGIDVELIDARTLCSGAMISNPYAQLIMVRGSDLRSLSHCPPQTPGSYRGFTRKGMRTSPSTSERRLRRLRIFGERGSFPSM